MAKWYMLTLVGEDRPGIVARLTAALYEGGANLGEAAMMRLGGNFTIMLMVYYDGSTRALQELVEPVTESLGLHLHIDRIEGHLHQHLIPDVRITVFGADRAGIVAQVTGALAEAGLNILDLQSDVGGSEDRPVYIMSIEGQAGEGVEALRSALDVITREDGIDVDIQPIDTMIG
ncbi:ACT domain-containing protein [Thiohalobacter sp. IOR34]|uniref:glycine cleavage system protein R n=1 Tax=Thiohalobacter sp. IOR34 TaxID=3057176 RepID=UPI0025B19DF9|nr:ACT domain-containing protein [Thiohalobacter sp. IOR34]WJW74920.1 ACT domain-containing protein [Thiohalobacter sp. IOR34]